jgi:hypothetical protein
MASVLAAVLDDMRAIIDGSSSASPISSGRYVAVEYDPETLLPLASQRPYPFELQLGPRFAPADYPTDISGDHAYYGRDVTVRVGYAGEPHEAEDQQDSVATDEDEIVLALEDVDSWSEADFVSCVIVGSEMVAAPIRGSETEASLEYMRVLEIQTRLIYREQRP